MQVWGDGALVNCARGCGGAGRPCGGFAVRQVHALHLSPGKGVAVRTPGPLPVSLPSSALFVVGAGGGEDAAWVSMSHP